MTKASFVILSSVMTLMIGFAPAANAQGLLFYLPEDGTGVEYEGTIRQTFIREDIEEGKEVVVKARELSIKSVGREEAVFEGVKQPCRWIEIKVVTGDSGAQGIDPGPVGGRIYKILVPEGKIIDQSVDADSVPNIVLPIVKGYRRNGESEIRPIRTPGLAIYPTICQLMNYPDPQLLAASEVAETKAANMSFTARHYKGRVEMERPESRSTNEADYWVTQEVPFGLARWKVVVTQERKQSTATRDQFREVSTTVSDMSVRRIVEFVESELDTPDE